MSTESDYRFAHGQHFVRAIRSSGYKNAAMALGELVDNSLQAGAHDVRILVAEEQSLVRRRATWSIKQIAVLDDGCGMKPELLRRALKLGGGTNFDRKDGMGKFGVGLPQASVSQAKRVDVWTWQNGPENCAHTAIDLSDKEWLKTMVVPAPDAEPIPKLWLAQAPQLGKSGTLVVWSSVDRLTWSKASTLYSHSEYLIGRMYRRWLVDPKPKSLAKWPTASIQLRAFDIQTGNVRNDWCYKPNDPSYLLAGTSVPDRAPGVPVLFEPYGEPIVKTYKVHHLDGSTTKETVTISFSLAPKALRQPLGATSAGATPYGKHAKRNVGVSIVRAGRELELSTEFTITKDPRNRWWGAEVQFERGLDEVLGVTNNKQHADRLASLADGEWEDHVDGNETEHEAKQRLKEDDFPTYVSLDIATFVNSNIKKLLANIDKNPVKGTAKKKRHDVSPEKKGTEATKKRREEGHSGSSDEGESLGAEAKRQALEEKLRQKGYDDDVIERIQGEVVDEGLKYAFVGAPFDSSAFFSVEIESGAILITLNTDHVAYEKFFGTLEDTDTDLVGLDAEQLRAKLESANDALRLMLEAWARLEDEAPTKKRFVFKDMRADWGRVAREFLSFGEVE